MSIFSPEHHPSLEKFYLEYLKKIREKTLAAAAQEAEKLPEDFGAKIEKLTRIHEQLPILLEQFRSLAVDYEEFVNEITEKTGQPKETIVGLLLADLVHFGSVTYNETVITISPELKLLLTKLMAEEVPEFSLLLLEILAVTPAGESPTPEAAGSGDLETTTETPAGAEAKTDVPDSALAGTKPDEPNSVALAEVIVAPESNPLFATTITNAIAYLRSQSTVAGGNVDNRKIVATVDLLARISTLPTQENSVTVLLEQCAKLLGITEEGARMRLNNAHTFFESLGDAVSIKVEKTTSTDGGRRKNVYTFLVGESSRDETKEVTPTQPALEDPSPQETQPDEYQQSLELIKVGMRGTTRRELFDYFYGLFAKEDSGPGKKSTGVTTNVLIELFGRERSVILDQLSSIRKILDDNKAPLRLLKRRDGVQTRWKLMRADEYERMNTLAMRRGEERVAAKQQRQPLVPLTSRALSSTDIARGSVLGENVPPKVEEPEPPATPEETDLEKKS